MSISITNLGSSNGTATAPDFDDNVDRTSYSNSAWTPPSDNNCIILLWVYNTRGTTLGSAGTVSGNGLTWTQQTTVGTDPGAQTHRLTCYAAISTGTAVNGATTVSFGSDTQSSCLMQFQQVTGVDLTGGLAGAIRQEPTNSSNAATSLAVTLSAAANSNNRFAAGIGHGQPEGATPENGWDELDDINGSGPGHALSTFWDSDSVADTTPSASWATSGAGLGIAIEIVAAAVSGTTYNEAVSISKIVDFDLGVEQTFDARKGNVATADFPANPTSADAFLANNVGTTSYSQSVDAGDTPANSVDADSFPSTGLEASDT